MEYVWLDVPIDSIGSVVVAFTLACGLGMGFPEDLFLHPLCRLLLCAARNGEVADNVNIKMLTGTDYHNVYYVNSSNKVPCILPRSFSAKEIC